MTGVTALVGVWEITQLHTSLRIKNCYYYCQPSITVAADFISHIHWGGGLGGDKDPDTLIPFSYHISQYDEIINTYSLIIIQDEISVTFSLAVI